MRSSLLFYLLPLWLGRSSALAQSPKAGYCSIFKEPVFDRHNCQPDIPTAFVDNGVSASHSRSYVFDTTALELAYSSLAVMQREFWEHYSGYWPSTNDWTSAFVHTAFSGMTDTLSKALDPSYADGVEGSMIWNMVDSYFTQIVGFYFGQHYMALRDQAYDDILWVVLGWLESTNFIKAHSALRYPRDDKVMQRHAAQHRSAEPSLGDALISRPWHGNDWMEPFAHRARVFWELATEGWGETLCGGGMRWTPHLLVYKNAITNQLWIAASARMYLDYPGDGIQSPYSNGREARNLTHLESALKGYDWLMNINMTNSAGLFVDGWHISRTPANNTECDEREESVYTYNQGVLLTGQRGLWEATGSPDFLRDGHQLIQNVIRATGWDLERDAPVDEIEPGRLPPWRGIGRVGILEERCDATGKCSQNGQTFKGIYFHHLNYFCMPIAKTQEDVDDDAFGVVAAAHAKACKSYLPWIAYNAEAALTVRDERGVFGEWWGAAMYGDAAEVWGDPDEMEYRRPGWSDYRNYGIPDDGVWAEPGARVPLAGVEEERGGHDSAPSYHGEEGDQQRVSRGNKSRKDPNKRGRGRTVETQNSGMALMRAWWELSQAYGEKKKSGWGFGGFGREWLTKLWWLWSVGQSLFSAW